MKFDILKVDSVNKENKYRETVECKYKKTTYIFSCVENLRLSIVDLQLYVKPEMK